MLEKCVFDIETICFKGVELKGVHFEASHEANAGEIDSESGAICQVVDHIFSKFGWLRPYLERIAAAAAADCEAHAETERHRCIDQQKLSNELTQSAIETIKHESKAENCSMSADDIRRVANMVADIIRRADKDARDLGRNLHGNKRNEPNNPRPNDQCNGNTGCQYCKKNQQ